MEPESETTQPVNDALISARSIRIGNSSLVKLSLRGPGGVVGTRAARSRAKLKLDRRVARDTFRHRLRHRSQWRPLPRLSIFFPQSGAGRCGYKSIDRQIPDLPKTSEQAECRTADATTSRMRKLNQERYYYY